MNPSIGLEPGVTKLYDHATGEEGIYTGPIKTPYGNEARYKNWGYAKWEEKEVPLPLATIEGFARAYDDRRQLAKLVEFSAEVESLTVHGWENAGDVLRQVRHAVLRLKGEKIWT